MYEPPLVPVEGQSWIGYSEGRARQVPAPGAHGRGRGQPRAEESAATIQLKGAPYPRSIDLVESLRAEARTTEEQNLITDLFERVVLYDLTVTAPTAVRRADGKWDVTVPVEAKKVEVDGRGAEKETTLAERIEVGLFTVCRSKVARCGHCRGAETMQVHRHR